ncbi:hypothetical protein ACJJTC_014762, partial [Scirpophaga incertulas]
MFSWSSLKRVYAKIRLNKKGTQVFMKVGEVRELCLDNSKWKTVWCEFIYIGDQWWAADGRGANTYADDMDTIWPRYIGSTHSVVCHSRCYVSSLQLFGSQA